MSSQKLLGLAVAASIAVLALPAAQAQENPTISFGDDTSLWANDGECDDPRFEGEGTSSTLDESDRLKDATDCEALLNAGRIQYVEASVDGIEFGDDSGQWANDDECDDPRFEGDGVAGSANRANISKDASDCRALHAAGRIRYSNIQYDPDLTEINGTELGDNSFEWANDDQCDDARFIGDGMAITPTPAAIKRDRDDCSYGFQLGQLTLAETLPDAPETQFDDIDFGHDKGAYAGDGECDDPRFSGAGMASSATDTTNIGGDRKDCLNAYKDGNLVFKQRVTLDGFYFGDEASLYSGDSECDDPRFAGTGMAAKPALSGIAHDGEDCMAAWRADTISPVTESDRNGILIRNGIVFGDDAGQYANDNECDDPGFIGSAMAASGGSQDSAGHDRTDCLTAFEAGNIKAKVNLGISEGITVGGILYGDDGSAFSQDGECDDPRFEGEGMASSLRSEDTRHDATDCLAGVQDGSISFKQ